MATGHRLSFDVRELLHGRKPYVFRIAFVVDGSTVRILRVRRGQRPVLTGRELEDAYPTTNLLPTNDRQNPSYDGSHRDRRGLKPLFFVGPDGLLARESRGRCGEVCRCRDGIWWLLGGPFAAAADEGGGGEE
jgi:hypothetical protein